MAYRPMFQSPPIAMSSGAVNTPAPNYQPMWQQILTNPSIMNLLGTALSGAVGGGYGYQGYAMQQEQQRRLQQQELENQLTLQQTEEEQRRYEERQKLQSEELAAKREQIKQQQAQRQQDAAMKQIDLYVKQGKEPPAQLLSMAGLEGMTFKPRPQAGYKLDEESGKIEIVYDGSGHEDLAAVRAQASAWEKNRTREEKARAQDVEEAVKRVMKQFEMATQQGLPWTKEQYDAAIRKARGIPEAEPPAQGPERKPEMRIDSEGQAWVLPYGSTKWIKTEGPSFGKDEKSVDPNLVARGQASTIEKARVELTDLGVPYDYVIAHPALVEKTIAILAQGKIPEVREKKDTLWWGDNAEWQVYAAGEAPPAETKEKSRLERMLEKHLNK